MNKNQVDKVSEEERKEGEDMANFKPIQATPVLGGADARSVMMDLKRKPSENAKRKNNKLMAMVKKLRN